MDMWSWLLAGLGLLQLWMSGSKLKANCVVGLITSACWFAYGLTFNQFGFLISATIFGAVHIRNWIRWN
jgi:hypothetical protein